MNKSFIYLVITIFFNIFFRIVVKYSIGFSEWYASNIYPVIVAVFARISNLFPFALGEIFLYMLIVGLIAGLTLVIKRFIKKPSLRIRTVCRAFLAVSCAASTFMLLFLFGCGINYNRLTFSEYSGLELQLYDSSDLKNVINEVTDELEKLVQFISTGEDDELKLDKNKLGYTARTSMGTLAEHYPELNTYYPNPKPVLLSKTLMSRSLIAGIFSPFTIEALYNSNMPDSLKPFTVCHELSHLSGFMREDEANFIAFLACRESFDVDFMYSGYLNALSYLINAYAPDVTADELRSLYTSLPQQVQNDIIYIENYWAVYRNSTVSKAVTAMNDVYLKSNGQADGVKSYGRLVDLLIADYKARNT